MLRKGLYGTKQGGKIWYKTFTNHLTNEVELIGHDADPCLFTKVDDNGEICSIASIYVDDAVIGGPEKVVKDIKDKVAGRFAIKDLGIAKHVVGIQVEQLPSGTLLTQQAYIDEIIELTGQSTSNILYVPMTASDPAYTLINPNSDSDVALFEPLNAEEHHEYREFIGKLMYFMVYTRPDIAFAVNFLA